MKKLIAILFLLSFGLFCLAQTPYKPQNFPSGIKVGKIKTGTGIVTVDSLTQFSTDVYKIWKGATVLSPYLPEGTFKIGSTPITVSAARINKLDSLDTSKGNVQHQLDGTLKVADGVTGTVTGDAITTITDPNAITFLRINANNTANLLSGADFRTAIGADAAYAPLAGWTTGTPTAPTAAVGTNTTQLANTNFVLGEKSIVSELNQMGCAFKSVTFGWTCLTSLATGITMVDGTVYFVLLDRITSSQTITGINAVNSTAGSYTADNTNGAALYLWNAGALTLVAQSATNLEAQYKTTATAKLTFPLSSPYSASAGVYYAAFLYNSSAQTTAPVLHGSASFSGAGQVFLPSTLRICGSLAGQATFPGSTTVGALTNASNPPISILY